MFGNNRPGPYDRGNMGPGAGGMGMGNGGGGMGGGGPIRNNFNGPRGRMMRRDGSEYRLTLMLNQIFEYLNPTYAYELLHWPPARALT